MRQKPLALALVAPISLALASLAPGEAHAGPCSALPNPVYVNGGGRIFIETLGRLLAGQGTTIVYKTQGSCAAVDSILSGTPLMGTEATGDGGIYWDAASEYKCDFDAGGNVADIGISDVFPTSCQSLPNGIPNDIGDYLGPVDAYGFAVPIGSTQKVISHDAAYFVFGFGAESGVDPWNDPAQIFIRNTDSGTLRMLAAAIGVDYTKWQGTVATSSGNLVTLLSMAPDKEKAIGILASEVALANKPAVKTLAYQDADQTCGYYMDSTPTASDKSNVRDGHYPIWGPLHILTKLDANGYPKNPVAGDITAYAIGTKDPKGVDLVQVLAIAGLIPECAMHVTRSSEMGPLSSFQPPRSCACYFDQLVTGTTNCAACQSANDCPEASPVCNYGYCEAQ